MRVFTRCFLRREDMVLLAKKRHGSGAGLWGGYGGKIDDGESSLDAIVREVWEESRLRVQPHDFSLVGKVSTYHNRKLYSRTDVFFACTWDGRPKDTREMYSHRWFPKASLPFDRMWRGDRLWLPELLKDTKADIGVYHEDGDPEFEEVFYKTLAAKPS